jgi:hypothetical protein
VVEKRNEEQAAAKKLAAERLEAEKRAAAARCSRPAINDSALGKAGTRSASVVKPVEKATRKPSKQVSVVVEAPSDEDEHIDGVTDWIGALMNARHLLPGCALPTDHTVCSEHPTDESMVLDPESVAMLKESIPSDLEEIKRLEKKMIILEDSKNLLLRQYPSADVQSLHTRKNLSAISNSLEQSKRSIQELLQEVASAQDALSYNDKHLQYQDSLKRHIERVPLDTRSQFLVEVR